MSIDYVWRSATGTAPALRLIESTADDLPPFWEVSLLGDAGLDVALAARAWGAVDFADLQPLTLTDGLSIVRLPPQAAEIRAACDSPVTLVVVGDLPRAQRPLTDYRALHPRFRGQATTGFMRRAEVYPTQGARIVFDGLRPRVLQLQAELLDERDVGLESPLTYPAPAMQIAIAAQFDGAVGPVPLGGPLGLDAFPLRIQGGAAALTFSTTDQPLGSALVITLCGDDTDAYTR